MTGGAAPPRLQVAVTQRTVAWLRERLDALPKDASVPASLERGPIGHRLRAAQAFLSCGGTEWIDDCAIEFALRVLEDSARSSGKDCEILTPSQVTDFLTESVTPTVANKLHGVSLFPLHVNGGHWAALTYLARDNAVWLWDSAPSPAAQELAQTFVDKYARALGRELQLRLGDCPSQEPGTNDCAVHTLNNMAQVIAEPLRWTRAQLRTLAATRYIETTARHMKYCEDGNIPLPTAPGCAAFITTDVARELARALPAGPARVTWYDAETNNVETWYGTVSTRKNSTDQKEVTFIGELDSNGVYHGFRDGSGHVKYGPFPLPTDTTKYINILRVGAFPKEGATVSITYGSAEQIVLMEKSQRAKKVDMVASDDGSLDWLNTDVVAADLVDRSRMPDVAATTWRQWHASGVRLAQPDEALVTTPWVAHLAQRNLTPDTRRCHRSILRRVLCNMPPHLADLPLATAVLEQLRLQRKTKKEERRPWSPQTFAKYLASTQGAMQCLALYTNAAFSVRLQDSVEWAQALRAANKDAHEAAMVHPPKALTQTQYAQAMVALGKETNTAYLRARLCLCLAWRTAGRFGCIRQLNREDVEVAPNGDTTVCFRRGKGVQFRGPYSVLTTLAPTEAAELRAFLSSDAGSTRLFPDEQPTTDVMRTLRNIDRELTQRSCRRGSLQALASVLDNASLMKFSGHTSERTLLRYLQWGKTSTAETRRAREGARSLIMNGAAPEPNPNSPMVGAGPSSLGIPCPDFGLSGRPARPRFIGADGRLYANRVTHADLGLESGDDPSSLPLHAKHVGLLNHEACLKLSCLHPELKELLIDYLGWTTDSARYDGGPSCGKIRSSRAFTLHDLQVLIAAGKLEEISKSQAASARGTVNAFWVHELRKRRRRPIFETLVNRWTALHRALKVQYPNRTARRTSAFCDCEPSACTCDWVVCQFDFSGWFDQFAYGNAVRDAFVFASHGRFFRLTRLAMGQTQAPTLAQLYTWFLLDYAMPDGVHVHTCIDNIRFSGPRHLVLSPIVTFLQRARQCNATVNDVDWNAFEAAPETFVEGRLAAFDTFLGEEYDIKGRKVRMPQHTIDKILGSIARMNVWSARNLAAHLGLLLWCAPTLRINVAAYHNALRYYRNVAALMTDETTQWDAPLTMMDNATSREILHWTQATCRNEWTVVPPRTAGQPDMHIFVDSSANGWGAIAVYPSGTITSAAGLFPAAIEHSAIAEPNGVRCALARFVTPSVHKHVVIVNDHAPIAAVFDRGYAKAYHINALQNFCATAFPTTYFRVIWRPGTSMIADRLSRVFSPNATLTPSEREQLKQEMSLLLTTPLAETAVEGIEFGSRSESYTPVRPSWMR